MLEGYDVTASEVKEYTHKKPEILTSIPYVFSRTHILKNPKGAVPCAF